MPAEAIFDLERFVAAQAGVYAAALAELRAGRKRSHWMWFVFPQLAGLGHSDTARFYAIGSLGEARAYLGHPLLGSRLLDVTRAALESGGDADAVFGYPDALKFGSCMTLFEAASGEAMFGEALARMCSGVRDSATLRLLDSSGHI